MKNAQQFVLLLIFIGTTKLSAQDQSETTSQKINSKWSLEANYGLNGNFFVRSYDELEGRAKQTAFLKKNFVGNSSGLELKYHSNSKSTFGLAYARTVNKAAKNFEGTLNNIPVFIRDFQIRHINDLYQVYYQKKLKKTHFNYDIGLVYATTAQQEIDLNFGIIIDERNKKNSGLEEGGIFLGLQYSRKIDTRFNLGIKSRIYYLVSVQTLEAITLTPTLSYNF
jgi:hypothetical protein